MKQVVLRNLLVFVCGFLLWSLFSVAKSLLEVSAVSTVFELCFSVFFSAAVFWANLELLGCCENQCVGGFIYVCVSLAALGLELFVLASFGIRLFLLFGGTV